MRWWKNNDGGWSMNVMLLCVAALTVALSTHTIYAAWDPAKPPTSGALVSADIRNNWTAIGQTTATGNVLADNTFLIWPAGDAAAPAHYTLSGAGAAVARTGTGLGDTTRKWGPYAAKITAGGGATGQLSQRVLTTTSYDDGFDGREISAGAWVFSSSAGVAGISLSDGAGSTSSASAGAGAWTWLTVTRTIDAAATNITWNFNVNASNNAYVSAPTVIMGPVIPQYPQHSPSHIESRSYFVAGNCATDTDVVRFSFPRPVLVRDVQLHVGTAPTTQALIVDVETFDGAAFQTMFSTRPQIAAAAGNGGAAPDGTYRYRGATAVHGTTTTNGMMRFAIDQCGSGTVGADLSVQIRYLTFDRPLEQFLEYNAIN